MSVQRSKAPLALMEQIIMILVFALASAVCLQAFVYADTLSKQGELRDLAVMRAQEMAECCKAEQGDIDQVGVMLGAKRTSDGLSADYPEDNIRVVLTIMESGDYIEKAKISVVAADGDEIFCIPIAWQVKRSGERE